MKYNLVITVHPFHGCLKVNGMAPSQLFGTFSPTGRVLEPLASLNK